MAVAARLGCALALALTGCATPTLTSDGQLVWTPGGQRGATVITANGVEFVDRADVPKPVPRASPYDPWQKSTGFLLPESGLWKRVSEPLRIRGDGIDLEVRASDTFAPSWGGEIFLRVEILAPKDKTASPPRRVVVVLDDRSEQALSLLQEVLARLGAGDGVAVIDAAGAEVVLPLVSASHRTLADAAWQMRAARAGGERDVALALERAAELLEGSAVLSQVVLVTGAPREGFGDEARLRAALARLDRGAVRLTAAASGEHVERQALAIFDRDPASGGRYADGGAAISSAIAPRAPFAARDLTLRVSSTPAPSRVLEASGGEVVTTIDEDLLLLGDVHAGDARIEVLRVSLPVFVPRELLSISIDAAWADGSRRTERRSHGTLELRYTDDVAALGRERNADVLADAAAMGVVGRLGKGAFGAGGRFDGFQHVATWASMSLSAVAADGKDPRLVADAAALRVLLQSAR